MMRYTFKAFFQDPDEADLAYCRLRERGLVEDVQIQSRPTEKNERHTLDLYGQASATTAAAALSSSMLLPIGLGYGWDPAMTSAASSYSVPPAAISALADSLGDWRDEDQAQSVTLYGHCQEQHLAGLNECVRRHGATRLLTSKTTF